MNKLKYTSPISNLPPFNIEDINLIQEAYLDGLNALASVVKTDRFIITGCELEVVTIGPPTDVTRVKSGWVYLVGEIYKVDEVLINTDPSSIYDDFKFGIQESVLAPSPVMHKDLIDRPIHYQRKAIVTPYSIGESAQALSNIKRYDELLVDMQITSWTPVTLSSGWLNGNNPIDNVHYRKEFRRVYLRGDVVHTGTVPTVNTPVFTLPYGFRPSINKMLPVLVNRGWDSTNFKSTRMTTDQYSSWIFIYTDGRVFLDPAIVPSICLEGVSFEI